MKDIKLICGHKLTFRIEPMEGEELWCVRCDDYREYTNDTRRPLCAAKVHRMSPYNITVDPATGRKCCRRCLQKSVGTAAGSTTFRGHR